MRSVAAIASAAQQTALGDDARARDDLQEVVASLDELAGPCAESVGGFSGPAVELTAEEAAPETASKRPRTEAAGRRRVSANEFFDKWKLAQ